MTRLVPIECRAAVVAIAIAAVVSGCGGATEQHLAAGGFGTGGKVLTPLNPEAFAIQADGRIVTTGGPFDLARYTPSGHLDPSFGRGGKVDRGWGSNWDLGGSGEDAAPDSNAIAIQHDGKIVLGGSFGGPWAHEHWDDFALARYIPSGRLDPSFGKGGTGRTHFGPEPSSYVIHALAIQPDGKIVAAGSTLARYTTDGRLDPTFGSGGRVAEPRVQGGLASFNALAIQTDAKIVAAGAWAGDGRAVSRLVLARYASDGTLDQSFGSGGVVWPKSDPGGQLWFAMQRDGKVVAVGSAVGGGFAVSRYSIDGHLDPSFGGDGRVTTDFPTGEADHEADGVAIQADGGIVVAGSSESDDGLKGSYILARYTADGQLDAGFGKGGRVETNLGSLSWVSGIAIQRDGKIVVAGDQGNINDRVQLFALVRYTRDGHLDS